MDSPRSSDAAAEGRRVYMGNLLYSVKPTDVEQVLQQTGFQYDKIHISVDPISGRNPGYCFVEFLTKEEADRALASLDGMTIFDRPVKLGPCHPKSNTRAAGTEGSPRREPRAGNAGTWGSSSPATNRPTFQRWGDWSGDRSPAAAQSGEQGPYGALKHLDETRNGEKTDGKRLYVGGLGKMIDQEQNDAEIRELFAGFDIVAIGKRITPHLSTKTKPGNHHYCFVDFSSQEEAERAMNATNKLPVDGGYLRVFPAKGKQPSQREGEEPQDGENGSPRRFDGNNGRPRFNNRERTEGGEQRGEGTPTKGNTKEEREEKEARQRAIMERGTWRRGN